MTMGGLLFGWASISSSPLLLSNESGGAGLSIQGAHNVYVAALFFSNLGPLFLGFLLDYHGPRVCSVFSGVLIALGLLLFANSNASSFPMFGPAMCLIAFGGPGAQNAIIHLSNLFPAWKSAAIAMITGSFQMSFFVFYCFNQLWLSWGYGYYTLFQAYSLICLMNITISLFMWPDEPCSFEEQVQLLREGSTSSEVGLSSISLSLFRLPSVMIKFDSKKLRLCIFTLQS